MDNYNARRRGLFGFFGLGFAYLGLIAAVNNVLAVTYHASVATSFGSAS